MTTDLDQNPLVETSWLQEHLGDEDLRIIDARWRGDGSGRQHFLAGHIPGAVHLDWQFDLACTQDEVRYQLLPPAEFAAVLSHAGIGSDFKIITYADQDYSSAARIWWALRLVGHREVGILNGGWDRWRAEGRPTENSQPVLTPQPFRAAMQPTWLVGKEEIQTHLDNPASRIQLVDTRPMEQFQGKAVWTPPGSRYIPAGQDWIDTGGRPLRGGHIPGAVHLRSSDNLDPKTWKYLSVLGLRKRALRAGLRPENRIIAYCGSGISASLGIFALYLAGFRDLGLYDASWEEWGADPSLPVQRVT